MSESPSRRAFFVSDRTGITAEMLGHSLLSQFEGMPFKEVTLPFVDSVERAQQAVRQIERAREEDGIRPLVFSTLVDPDLSSVIATADALYLDCFQRFILPMEQELGVQHTREIGRAHRVRNLDEYHARIEAVNFVLSHDDGVSTKELTHADVVLVGVSRCGKTPTCLYLGLQYGIRAANYPLIPEDFRDMNLPAKLQKFRRKLFGLTIQADRLAQIRNERRPNSNYAQIENCQYEIDRAELLMRQEGIPYIDATNRSIEELATTILHQAQLQRQVY
ncbi:MAG: kinase/pyrophosphorylase [Betaproteobacteria bacterium]|nr:kinase/pyrophosphorylase [Betaproteobacteria bacterium]MBL8533406.1 kinase/pyrophosphorylase [Betaproteobacteria bacterium]